MAPSLLDPLQVPSQRQYLRVKRRRTDATPSSLRLEGVHQSSSSNAALVDGLQGISLQQQQQQHSISTLTANMGDLNHANRKRRPTTAILRRVTEMDASMNENSFRVVDAVLGTTTKNAIADTEEPVERGNKRRRLTLVESKTIHSMDKLLENSSSTSPTNSSTSKSRKKKKQPFKVLTPDERLVDESLKKVYQGEITPRQHYDFLLQEETLRHKHHQWLSWRNVEAGNLLHACALWNDAELAAILCSMDAIVSIIGSQEDCDNRSPFEVAELMGHTQVIQVLEAYGLYTSNYVYDLYCLDDIAASGGEEASMEDSSTPQNNSTVDSEAPKSIPMDDFAPVGAMSHESEDWTCQLHGGFGYWDDGGHLLLTTDKDQLIHEKDEVNDDNDDEDSNDEGYIGNDYPDEGVVYWGGGGLGADVDDDSEDEGYNDTNFRYAPYDNGEDDYDAAYGIYGQE